MPDKAPELLPCPFCGSEAIEIMTATDEEICHDTKQVVCRNCGAVGGIDHVGQGDEDAATMWNRRVAPKLEPLTLEQLQEMGGEPLKHWVWIEILDTEAYHENAFSGYQRCHRAYAPERNFSSGWPGVGYDWAYSEYGKTWLAYTTKPEGTDGR